MARKKPIKEVEAVPVEARALWTITEDASIWMLPSTFSIAPLEGCIVRLRPPAECEDADVERVRKKLLASGAARVTVLPRPRKELLPEGKAAKTFVGKAVGPREAVLELAAESNSADREALAVLAEQVMAAEGL